MGQNTYRYHTGDVLRLRHTSPLAAAGEYVLRAVGDTVCLGRLVNTTRGRRISRKPVYMLITDLCVFEETGRRYRTLPSAEAIDSSPGFALCGTEAFANR